MKTPVNCVYETSEVRLVSNIQMMNGSSTNISRPLTRCRMDTQPARGSRYWVASIRRIVPGLREEIGLEISVIPTLCAWLVVCETKPEDFIATQQIRVRVGEATAANDAPSRPISCVATRLTELVPVVMRACVVEAAPQLDRLVAIGARQPLHAEQRLADRH